MLWRQTPSEQVSENGIVAERNQIVQNPKARSVMAMEEISGWDEFLMSSFTIGMFLIFKDI